MRRAWSTADTTTGRRAARRVRRALAVAGLVVVTAGCTPLLPDARLGAGPVRGLCERPIGRLRSGSTVVTICPDEVGGG